MKRFTIRMATTVLGITLAGIGAAPAAAQATRTWVSGVGDDVNPCSRTAPCKTFAGAISKTAAGGEINCLDPGGFGAVTITKSMTISCPYTEGGALAGGNGITVNDALSGAPNTIVVFLRGLDIFGVNPPSNGVRFVSGAALHIEDSTIRRFNAANSQGISFAPAGAAKLYLNNVTVADNGSGATGGGILIQPSGSGSADVFMTNVRVHNNANNGIRIDAATSGVGGVAVSIEETDVGGNVNGISTNSGASFLSVIVNDSNIVHNTGTGIIAAGLSTSMIVGNTTIMGNNTGVSLAGGAVMHTYGDNRLDANPHLANANNGAFTQPPLQKK
jgi:hypothetical protein